MPPKMQIMRRRFLVRVGVGMKWNLGWRVDDVRLEWERIEIGLDRVIIGGGNEVQGSGVTWKWDWNEKDVERK